MGLRLLRVLVIATVAAGILAPVGLVIYQSLLNAPFFSPAARVGLDAYRFVWGDPGFRRALLNSFVTAVGMTAVGVAMGSLLAFIVVRGHIPGARVLELCILTPAFLSSIVLGFGYVVAAGPVGFLSLAVKQWWGTVPWHLYTLGGLIVVAGLTHVPQVFLYTAAALRSLDPSLEEAARVAGAGPWRIAFSISLPLVWPAVLFSGALLFLLGFELFGLPLVLVDPAGITVLTTYLYKLTNLLGVPAYHLMAVVAVSIVLITVPLTFVQRRMLGGSARFATVRGRGRSYRPLPLGRWQWPAFLLVLAFILVTVAVPLAGLLTRSVVRTWGEGVVLREVLTLDNFRALSRYPNLVRSIANTLGIGVVGGLLSVGAYTAAALSVHRWPGRWSTLLEYLALTPRAIPGLVVGLAFLWVFLFFRPLSPLRSTLFSIWLAYTVVWLPYGLRLISASLLQISPELEEAARVAGASPGRTLREVTLPLIRFGLVGSWLLIFMTFVREYSTGVYLMAPGNEVIGSVIVSLLGGGAVQLIAALSVVEVVLVGAALFAALRLGVRLDA